MRRLGAVAAMLVSMPLLLDCARRGADGETSHRDAEIALEVENHSRSDVVIYLMRGSAAQRLGMVTALSTDHFVFPYDRIGSSGNTRLRVYPIGGPRGYTSEELLVQPGQWIRWTLATDLSRSSLAVY